MSLHQPVGIYNGDLSITRVSPGHYVVTGPRGSVTLRKARERVYVRSWARSRYVTMTVWNPSDCTAELNMWHEAPRWARTLREAIDNCTSALCTFKCCR